MMDAVDIMDREADSVVRDDGEDDVKAVEVMSSEAPLAVSMAHNCR